MLPKKIIIFGRVPPPYGGVTVSVKNFIASMETKGISTFLFSFSTLFGRYDVAHVNYSRIWKIAAAVIIGKIIAKKSVFVIHGNDFDVNCKLNLLILRAFNGVIALNQGVYRSLATNDINCVLLSPIFKEGLQEDSKEDLIIKKREGKKYILVYINDYMVVGGKEVYGAFFFSEAISQFSENVVPVVLDIKNKFSHLFSEKQHGREIIYIAHPVNFQSLLRQVDLYVRPTSNDGSSVAILEALMLNKCVLASDAVDRPDGVNVYKYGNMDDFIDSVSKLLVSESSSSDCDLSSVVDFLEFVYAS